MPDQAVSWDLLADLQLLLQFHFMQNAFVAGTLVALLAGVAGYFVVLRGQSFAAHTLSQVGFLGAAAGVLLHVSPVLGLIAFCVAAALGFGWHGRDVEAGNRAEAATVGSILAFSLGLRAGSRAFGERPQGQRAGCGWTTFQRGLIGRFHVWGGRPRLLRCFAGRFHQPVASFGRLRRVSCVEDRACFSLHDMLARR